MKSSMKFWGKKIYYRQFKTSKMNQNKKKMMNKTITKFKI